MAARSTWAEFPHDAKAFAYAGDSLKKAWSKLHAGDCEPFPDDRRAAALIEAAGKAAPKGLDAEALATALQEAWRAFHRGDFQVAFDAGRQLGPVGASVAVKAIGIHATISSMTMRKNCGVSNRPPHLPKQRSRYSRTTPTATIAAPSRWAATARD